MAQYEPVPGFKLEAMRDSYVSGGHLTALQFDQCVDSARRVLALKLLPGTWWWGVYPQVTCTFPHLLTEVHLKAQAAALSLPFSTVENHFKALRERGVGNERLNRTTFGALPKPGSKLGTLLVELGLIGMRDLQGALGLQAMIRDETSVTPRLGLMIWCTTQVSLPDLLQAVGLQRDIPYEGLDAFVRAYEAKFAVCAIP